MEGSTNNINQLVFRNSLVAKKEPKTPKALPFSFNRTAPKVRTTSVASGIPSLSRSQNTAFSTQSFHLPENAAVPPSALGRSPLLFSAKSSYSDPARLAHQLPSQTKFPSFDSRAPFATNPEDQDPKTSSPAPFEAHTSPFENRHALGSLSSNVPMHQPLETPSSNAPRGSVGEMNLSGGNMFPEPGEFILIGS